jgi:predicted ATPase
MLITIAIGNYRSVRRLVGPFGRLNVITGPNGSGKSNLYRALRLLASAADGSIAATLAREGGFDSTMWAGPETTSRAMRSGDAPVQGVVRREPVRLRLGFTAEDFGYAITLGLPSPSSALAWGSGLRSSVPRN